MSYVEYAFEGTTTAAFRLYEDGSVTARTSAYSPWTESLHTKEIIEDSETMGVLFKI